MSFQTGHTRVRDLRSKYAVLVFWCETVIFSAAKSLARRDLEFCKFVFIQPLSYKNQEKATGKNPI